MVSVRGGKVRKNQRETAPKLPLIFYNCQSRTMKAPGSEVKEGELCMRV